MPIVDVEIVEDRGRSGGGDTRVHSVDAPSSYVFGSETGITWVRLRCLSRGQYAENGGEVPPEVRPVFVSVLKATLPEEDELAEEAKRVAGAVATVLGRPRENVHVIYTPEGVGRVAFGGVLRRKG